MSYKMRFVIAFFFILFSFISFPFPLFANSVPNRSHSYLSVSSSVPADGQTTAIITVTLQDSSGNPVIGNSVTLEDSSNSGATITTISGTTDASGHALFSIKSSKAQTDNLNVTDTSSNITFYNVGEVTFTTGSCYDSAPGSTPRLISALSNSPTQITLTWTAASNPVTQYLLSYGLASGQYIYGNPNVGSQGTTSYTVGSLSPGKKYYFVIQAINGCASGNFSNEISTIAGDVNTNTSIPIQTPIKETSLKTNNQNDSIPTNAPNQNDVMPTSVPIQSQNIQPTTIILPAQTSTADNSNAKILLIISISIWVIGSIGNLLYWKHKESVQESTDVTEENRSFHIR